MRRRKNKLLLICILLSGSGLAQQFHYSASLDVVSQDGFYSIPVTPSLSSNLKTDLSDIRIADEKGQWVPHIINWSQKNAATTNRYFELPVIKKENINTATILFVNNAAKKNLSGLFLLIKNSAAGRTVIVSGSDDQTSWFSITDSISLKASLLSDGRPAFAIAFPVVNYNFFRVTIYNGRNDPLNILNVIYEAPDDHAMAETYIPNPSLKFIQNDSAGYSLVRIENPDSFHVNRWNLSVSSPKFFERRARLYSGSSGDRIQDLLRSAPLREYILTSEGSTDGYETPWIKNIVFYLLIENRDNPPLKITVINTEQIRKELVTYLEKGKRYHLLFDDPKAIPPDYDLQIFKHEIPGSLVSLNIAGKVAIHSLIGTNNKSGRRTWIWPVMIAVLITMGFFTWSLIRDMKKQNSTRK